MSLGYQLAVPIAINYYSFVFSEDYVVIVFDDFTDIKFVRRSGTYNTSFSRMFFDYAC